MRWTGWVPAAVLLAACGGGGSPVRAVEDAVAAAFAPQLDVPVEEVVVVCPDGAATGAGSTVVCEVAVGDATAQPVPFEIGDGGRATLAVAVLPVAAVEAHVAAEVAAEAADVDCGTDALAVGEVGSTFTCEVAGGGVPADVYEVTVTSLDGEVRVRPAPDRVAGP